MLAQPARYSGGSCYPSSCHPDEEPLGINILVYQPKTMLRQVALDSGLPLSLPSTQPKLSATPTASAQQKKCKDRKWGSYKPFQDLPLCREHLMSPLSSSSRGPMPAALSAFQNSLPAASPPSASESLARRFSALQGLYWRTKDNPWVRNSAEAALLLDQLRGEFAKISPASLARRAGETAGHAETAALLSEEGASVLCRRYRCA